ncbi:hypothetical protein N7504_006797 [Penicillium tannophilum]|nr:hypothetical protein N7504_006797 [Penicillium tannophilum]
MYVIGHFVAVTLRNQESRSVGDSRHLNPAADGICEIERLESKIDDIEMDVSTFWGFEHPSPDNIDDVRDS